MSLSRVIGRSRIRLPVAWNTALATAAAEPVAPTSPRPTTPIGIVLSGWSSHVTSIGGMSAWTGT